MSVVGVIAFLTQNIEDEPPKFSSGERDRINLNPVN